MKRTFNYYVLVCLMAAASNSAYAQATVQLPSTPNTFWFSTPIDTLPLTGLNVAMINYSATNPLKCLIGGVYSDWDQYNGGTDTIHFFDPSITGSAVSLIPYNILYGYPSITIGNWDGNNVRCPSCVSTSTDYMAAVAYWNLNNDVEIDIYDVYDNGSSVVSVNPTPVHTYSISGYEPDIVHINAIQTTTGTPFHKCYDYFVTFDDWTNINIFQINVYAAYGSLDGGNPTLPVQINTTSNGMNPDVAAITRIVSGSPDQIALITYNNFDSILGPHGVYYSEWDYTANTVATPTLLDNSFVFTSPRIDAVKNPSGAWSWNSTPAQYKVVAWVDTEIGIYNCGVIRTYDNYLNATGTVFDCSDDIDLSTYPGSLYPAPNPLYNAVFPSVALGSGNDYRVQHILMPNLSSTGMYQNMVFMEPVNYNSPGVLDGSYCYWVNSDPTGTTGDSINSVSCNGANAVCSGVNDQQGSYVLYAWAQYDSTNGGNVYFKLESPSLPYAFRHTAPAATVQSSGYQVYPNPTADVLTVTTTGATNTANTFYIMDVTGRTVLNGSLSASNAQGSSTTLNVATLIPGTYLIKLYDNSNSVGSSLFVKN